MGNRFTHEQEDKTCKLAAKGIVDHVPGKFSGATTSNARLAQDDATDSSRSDVSQNSSRDGPATFIKGCVHTAVAAHPPYKVIRKSAHELQATRGSSVERLNYGLSNSNPALHDWNDGSCTPSPATVRRTDCSGTAILSSCLDDQTVAPVHVTPIHESMMHVNGMHAAPTHAVAMNEDSCNHQQHALKVSHSFGHVGQYNSASTIAANPKLAGGPWQPLFMARIGRYDPGPHSSALHARGEVSSWRTRMAEDDDRTPPLLSTNSGHLVGIYPPEKSSSVVSNDESVLLRRPDMPQHPHDDLCRNGSSGVVALTMFEAGHGVPLPNQSQQYPSSNRVSAEVDKDVGNGRPCRNACCHHVSDASSESGHRRQSFAITPRPQQRISRCAQFTTADAQGLQRGRVPGGSATEATIPAHGTCQPSIIAMDHHPSSSQGGGLSARPRLRSTSAGRIELYLKPVPKGYAVKSYGNGDRYEGELVRGKRDGYGLMFSANGEAYVGQWFHDMRSGRGLQFYTPWGRYEGEFRNDMRSGWGMLVMRRHGTYFGQFLANKKHGRGVLVHPRGEVYAEWWSHGKLVKRVWLKDLLFQARRAKEEPTAIEMPIQSGSGVQKGLKKGMDGTCAHADPAVVGIDAKKERHESAVHIGRSTVEEVKGTPLMGVGGCAVPVLPEASAIVSDSTCSKSRSTVRTDPERLLAAVTGGIVGLPFCPIVESERTTSLNPIAEVSEAAQTGGSSPSNELHRQSSDPHESDQSPKSGTPRTNLTKLKSSDQPQVGKTIREVNGQRLSAFDSVASTAASSMLQTSIFGASGFTTSGYSGPAATDPSNPSSGCSQSIRAVSHMPRRCLCITCPARIASTSVMSAFVGAMGGVSDNLREHPTRKKSDVCPKGSEKRYGSDSGVASLSSREILRLSSSDSHPEPGLEKSAPHVGSMQTRVDSGELESLTVVGRSASLPEMRRSHSINPISRTISTRELWTLERPPVPNAKKDNDSKAGGEPCGSHVSPSDRTISSIGHAPSTEERVSGGGSRSLFSWQSSASRVGGAAVGEQADTQTSQGRTGGRRLVEQPAVALPKLAADIHGPARQGISVDSFQGRSRDPASVSGDSQNIKETHSGTQFATTSEQATKAQGGRCLISPGLSSCSSSCSTKDHLPELARWSTADVAEFLCCLGLGHLKGVFQRHQIGGEELINSTEDDLENELRIRDATHRQLLVQTAQALARCEAKSRFRGQPWVVILRYLREVFKECLISSITLRRCRLIGEGGFGLVYKGLWGGEAEVAIKAFRVAAFTAVPTQRPAAPAHQWLAPGARARLGPSNQTANAASHHAADSASVKASKSLSQRSNRDDPSASSKTFKQDRSSERETSRITEACTHGDRCSLKEARTLKKDTSSGARRKRQEDERLAERQRHRLAFMLLDLADEAKVLMTLRHPNVTIFWGVCLDIERQWLVTQFVSGGSLFNLIHSSRGVLLDSLRITKIALGICSGMAYVHAKGLLHCDLKSPNVLLDENLEPKICDFGLALRTLDCPAAATRGRIGTPQWMAPEVLRGAEYSKAADVFSFGVVMWEMLSRRVPHGNLTLNQVMAAVGWGNHRLEPVYHCPEVLNSLLKQCLHRVPMQRPTFQQLVKEFSDILASGMLEADSRRLLAKPLRRFKETTRRTLGSVEQLIFGPPL